MAVAGDDLSAFQSGPEVVRNGLVAEIATDLFLHLLQPIEDFLIGSAKRSVARFWGVGRGNVQAMQRASQAIETG